jgi:hypothetical protein
MSITGISQAPPPSTASPPPQNPIQEVQALKKDDHDGDASDRRIELQKALSGATNGNSAPAGGGSGQLLDVKA